jgi:bifunctional DNA-binding transcriptional regulator/antitoxin component of YhaV-PrlF toxin-antitoxin module
MEQFKVALDGSGRILLPAKVRKQLKLKKGSELIARVKEEQLVLQTRSQVLREVQEFFSKRRPAGVLWSDEIIKDRRREARRELDD